MSEKHQKLIEFQFGILESLANKENIKDMALKLRNFMNSFYCIDGSDVPNGLELGINVNNECNLRCGHCYYATTHLQSGRKENALSKKEWIKLINDAMDFGINHINILGQEPLLSPEKTKTILSEIKRRKINNPKIQYELITNGTLIEKEIDWLSQFPDFYFFSVSLDGYGKYHDYIRGEGNYKKAMQGIKIAGENGIQNMAVLSTATPTNVDSFGRMWEELPKLGVKYISTGLCFPTKYNKQDLKGTLSTFESLLKQTEKAPRELDICINFMGDMHARLIMELYKRGFIEKAKSGVTADMAPSLFVTLNKEPRRLVQFGILPITHFSGFRIDYDGTATDFCDAYLEDKVKGFGNVKEKSISDLYKISKTELWPKYTEKFFGRLSQAFNGKNEECFI